MKTEEEYKTVAIWQFSQMGVCNDCLEKLSDLPTDKGFDYNVLCDRCRELPDIKFSSRWVWVAQWMPNWLLRWFE